jgi:hypothetical protein
MTRTAAAPQLAARSGRPGGFRERRNREALHFHAADRVGIAFVVGAFLQLLLLRGEEPRRIRAIRLVQIARPEVARFIEVQIAVDDEVAVACHLSPPENVVCPRFLGGSVFALHQRRAAG